MGDNLFEVRKSGLSTTIQDLGRTGFQQYGVVGAGAMDTYALQIGNILVGNRRGEAGLEIAVIGPELLILRDTVIAICGADLSPLLDGKAVSLWKSFRVKSGQILRFGQPKIGVYAYITVANGIKAVNVLGSKSTYVKGAVGGFSGRSLEKGDVLQAERSEKALDKLFCRGISAKDIPDYASKRQIRVILGPDEEMFSEESIAAFLQGPFKVTRQSDRMGYRLEGPKLEHLEHADIISDGILPGTIQVPASGEPIILLADRQTVGGYARIATIISVDLVYVAQQLFSEGLTFTVISVEEAQQLFIEQEQLLRQLSVGAGLFP